ncbi:phytanoyl-CoA dioxygenase family protein [Legionella shakespearei]|uniref:Phytanoyl-CoA dioxygenase n=1 Tax=Legionella shakespearei DSM 23087 TaxID=1122169 RepID=A0A0W0YZU4_9GAMM|nr:phytanoyl-CoA dioxygenase family protein [Legionella shakespearei]KTD62393.1 phytanoyl-CoA dioxygenase [Legionella shakespearei DSM 23087]
MSQTILENDKSYPSNKELLDEFHSHGVITLEDYISETRVDEILEEIQTVTDKAQQDLINDWNNQKICFYSVQKHHKKSPDEDFANKPYFLESKDKSHIFYEKIANTYQINRIGHALHKETNYPGLGSLINDKMIQFLKALNYLRPVCHLSVYIPKYGFGLGSKVKPHQENTFAYSEPTSALVLWIALEDATIENACLWGIPGSNHWPLKYISKLDSHRKQRTFYQINDVEIPNFETEIERYKPLEVKKGSALIMHGNFVHASPANFSSKSRQSISLQFLETANTHYPNFNWIWPGRTDYLYDLTNDINQEFEYVNL